MVGDRLAPLVGVPLVPGPILLGIPLELRGRPDSARVLPQSLKLGLQSVDARLSSAPIDAPGLPPPDDPPSLASPASSLQCSFAFLKSVFVFQLRPAAIGESSVEEAAPQVPALVGRGSSPTPRLKLEWWHPAASSVLQAPTASLGEDRLLETNVLWSCPRTFQRRRLFVLSSRLKSCLRRPTTIPPSSRHLRPPLHPSPPLGAMPSPESAPTTEGLVDPAPQARQVDPRAPMPANPRWDHLLR